MRAQEKSKKEGGAGEKSKEQGVAERNHYSLTLTSCALPKGLRVTCGDNKGKRLGRGEERCFP